MIARRVVTPSAEMLGHQTLKRQSVDLLRCVERPAGTVGAKHPGIKEIELGMGGQFPLCPFGEHPKAESEQQILQDFEVTFHGFPAHLTVPRNIAEVEHRSEERRVGKECRSLSSAYFQAEYGIRDA